MKSANVRYCQRFARLEKSKLEKIFSTQREFKKSPRDGGRGYSGFQVAGMIEEALMAFKYLNGPAPEYLSSIFMGRTDTIPYTFLDSVNKLTIPQPART